MSERWHKPVVCAWGMIGGLRDEGQPLAVNVSSASATAMAKTIALTHL